jgi:hypothetical protein
MRWGCNGFEPLPGETFINAKARHLAGLCVDHPGSVTLVTFTKVATNAATQSSAQAGADGGTGLAAQAVTDHRPTCSAHTTANRGLGAAAFTRGNSAAGGARDASADCCARAAAHALSDHVTQGAAQATADRGSAVASGHRTLRNEKSQNQSRQC